MVVYKRVRGDMGDLLVNVANASPLAILSVMIILMLAGCVVLWLAAFDNEAERTILEIRKEKIEG